MGEEAREEEYQEEEQGTPAEETASEKSARVQGWVTYDEWVDRGGDPEQWKPAEKFVKDGEEITGIIKERNAKLERDVQDLKKSLQDMKQMLSKREQKGYEKALQDIKRKQEKAVEDGDTEQFREAEKEREEIQKEIQGMQSSEQGQPQDPTYDPVFQQWVAENKWYQTGSQEMVQYAEISAAPYVRTKHPNLTGKPFLDKVTEEVKARFPDEFKNPNRDKAAAVEGDRKNAGGGKKKKAYGDLPADAKEACDRFVKQGTFKNRDEYVKEYFAQEGE